MINLINIFKILRTGNTPTEKDWKEIFSSIWHKSEKLPISQIFGLKEEIAKVTTNFKGYHTSLDGLLTAHPQSENKKDFYAWVGSPYPGTVYVVKENGGAWTDTGEVPTQQEIDLAEYAKYKNADDETVLYSHKNIALNKEGSVNNDTSGNFQRSTGFYLIESIQKQLRNKPIDYLILEVKVAGVLTITKSKTVGLDGRFDIVQAFNVDVGWQVLKLDNVLMLQNGESIGLLIASDTAKIGYLYGQGKGSQLFSFINDDGVWSTSTSSLNLEIGGYSTLTSLEESINNLTKTGGEFSILSNTSPTANSSVFADFTGFYLNEEAQSLLRGKPITKITVYIQKVGVFSVMKGTNVGLSGFSYEPLKVITYTSTGLKEIIFDDPLYLANNEYLGIGYKTDTAQFGYTTTILSPNQSFIFHQDGAWETSNSQLNIGVYTEIIDGEIPKIEKEVHVLSNRVSELEEAGGISSFKYNKYVAVGDSNTRGFIPRNHPNTGGQLNSYAMVTGAKIAQNFINFGVDGSNLTAGMVDIIDVLPDDADLITVMGGTNDFRGGVSLGSFNDTTQATYYGALKIISQKLITKYHTNRINSNQKPATLVWLTPFKLLKDGGWNYDPSIQNWVKAVIEVGAYYSIPVLDLNNLTGVNPHLDRTLTGSNPTGMFNPLVPDGIHLTEEAHEMVANILTGYLRTLK